MQYSLFIILAGEGRSVWGPIGLTCYSKFLFYCPKNQDEDPTSGYVCPLPAYVHVLTNVCSVALWVRWTLCEWDQTRTPFVPRPHVPPRAGVRAGALGPQLSVSPDADLAVSLPRARLPRATVL